MKKLTAATIFSLLFLFAKADTFIVTSSADSGPGTLREAISLANANGSAIPDFIHFNITDLSADGRTIALQSSFPDLVSNLLIDGSTQPGAPFGISDAKIRITTAAGFEIPHVFRIVNEHNLSFLGLHLDNLRLYSPSLVSGVFALQNARNIQIGEPGKGNYFTRLPTIMRDAYFLPAGKGMNDSIAFRSNIVNLSEDGNSLVSSALVFAFDNVRNLSLGGEQEQEGNFISTGGQYIGWTYTDSNAHVNTGVYSILNNKFGSNFSQTAALPCGALYLRNGNSYGFTDTTRIIIRNNSFNTACFNFTCPLYNYIMLEGKSGFIDIKSNRFGHLNGNSDFFFSTALTAISISGCEDGIIGGDNPADSNFIAGQRGYGIALGGNKAIRITKNSIFCNRGGIKVSSAQLPVPKTAIFTITDYLVEGTTLPLSKVEVFLTKQCAGCDNGKLYLGYTMAGADGAWSFTSPVLLDGAVSATGTSPQGVTGEFAKPEFSLENYTYQSPSCNQNNGYIKGVKFVAGTRYYWIRAYNGSVDTLYTEEVTNAGPGYYRFVVEQGAYCSTIHYQSLEDQSPRINAQYTRIVQPSCGMNNGRITDLYLSGSYNKITWKDSSGNVVGNTQELLNAGPGQYKLIILDTVQGCGDSTQYYTLRNQAGPSLQLDNVQISPAACGSPSGSIKGITATGSTGTVRVNWIDSLNNVVGSGFELKNVRPGKYRLRFKDDGGCDTLFSPFYTIANAGEIRIDTTGKIVSPAKCSGNTGSIQNISVSGGDSYEWKNTVTQATVGTSAALSGLPAGTYQLTVSNNEGCSQESAPITVPQATFLSLSVQVWTSKAAGCGQPNGQIDAQAFSRDTSLYTFRWVDSASSRTVGSRTRLLDIPGGTYFLFAKDSNGCEQRIFRAAIVDLPIPSFDYTTLQITPDQCMSSRGAIKNLVVKDLASGTGTYTWLNTNGDSVGNTLNLQNIPQGSYRLKATDRSGCTVTSQTLAVANNNITLPAPQYDEQTILKNTSTTLKVKNGQPGTYRLFSDPSGTTPEGENNNGTFTTPVLAADQTFYVRYINGVCQSDLVAVTVKVLDRTAVYVPTAFSPNRDGKNDVLKAIAYGKVRLVYFTVYNRWGQVVFTTTTFSKGWDGTISGQPAETGVYVWVVKAVDELSGTTLSDRGTVAVIR